MLPSVSNYATAQKAAQVVCHILVDELKLQYPEKFLLTEHGRFVWLLAVMDDLNLGGPMNKYIHEATVHRLSTALNGLPVYISNHSGLRYAVLLSDKPRLPGIANFPAGELERDLMPLGVDISGTVDVHAKQIVNMIVVGAQDSGKSMLLRSLAHSARLHGALLCLADPLLHTFNPDIWNATTVLPVARNKGEFLTMLQLLNQEINRRSDVFRSVAKDGMQPTDIDEYNEWGGEIMPRVWMIADEVNSLLDSNAVKEALGEPARAGRKYGVHLVLAGHDWHEYTVPRGLSSYFETRLCLRTSNDTAGRIVLDDVKRGKRTMQFNHPGRAILRLRGQYQDVQLYYVSPDQERRWFVEMRHAPVTVKWSQQELTSQQPVASDQPDKIAQLAESIREQWTPELSKRAVGRLLGIEYAGNWTKLIDQVIEFLTANANTANSANVPDSGVFSPNQALPG